MRVPGLLANGLQRFRGSTGARSYGGLGGAERDLPYRKVCRGWDWLVGRPWAGGGCPTRTVMTPAAVRSEGNQGPFFSEK